MKKTTLGVKKNTQKNNNVFSNMQDIVALSDNQQKIIDSFDNGKNLLLCGYPGTGKSYLALALALNAVNNNEFSSIRIIRSVVPSRDMGFLPGSEKEKIEVYERPYRFIVNNLLKRDDAYDILKNHKKIQFESSSFLRGITYEDTILIIDEFQNMAENELHTIMTRLDENTRIIFCGDIGQTDLNQRESGFNLIKRIIDSMTSYFDVIELGVDDIVRSGIVKEYIITKEKLSKPSNSIYKNKNFYDETMEDYRAFDTTKQNFKQAIFTN